jgi:hypothetical protein
LGRFTSIDNPKFSEKTDPQTWNLYAYVSNNPLVRIDPLGYNWFKINGEWLWYKGSDVDAEGNPCKKGSKGCYHSDYTHMLVIQKTGGKTEDGAAKIKYSLYGNADPKTIKPIKVSYGFSGSFKYESTPNGDYEINLNMRGGPETESLAFDGSLAAYDGIQRLGPFQYYGAWYTARGDWGDLRANLNDMRTGKHTPYYLHGKQNFFDYHVTWTHGCSSEPSQRVLQEIFKLDPHGVGEGAKNGRLAVTVGSK